MTKNKTAYSGQLSLFLLLLVTILWFGLISPIHAEDTKEITIGVLAHRGVEKANQMWQPTAQYLETQVKGYHFSLIPLTLTEMEQAVSSNELDFILTNTGITSIWKLPMASPESLHLKICGKEHPILRLVRLLS